MKKFLLSGFLTAMIFSIYAQTQVGRTRYDLQTNNSVCRRVAVNPAGETVVTFTKSYLNAPNFDDRGVGYNYSSDGGTSWSETTFTGTFNGNGTFNESDIDRNGWPNVVFTKTKEVIISHFAGGSTVGLQVKTRELGTTGAFTTLALNSTNATSVNTDQADGATWARAAARGDSIFVITGLGEGSTLPGMTGGLLMYRSIDAGATWIGPDVIPLVNSSNFLTISGDNYALDVNENGKIAIVMGSYQVEVLTSTDWGATFTKQTVAATRDLDGNSNPLFSGASGETLDTMDISDGSYSIVIDDNDKVHVWFGRQRSWKDDAAATGTFYSPLVVGLVYWNDAMTEGQIIHKSRLAAQQVGVLNPLFTGQLFDADGEQANLYGVSFTSMASGGYDDAGNIFVAYSAMKPATFDDVNDLTTPNNVNDAGFHFSDVYLLTSSDNGATWVGPINVSDEPLKECVFPSVPRKIYDTDIPVVWQQDSIPGTNLQAPATVTHPDVDNSIMFTKVAISSITTPTDITAPTLSEIVENQNTVTAFIGCLDDINFSTTFNNDDVPTGPDVLDYILLDASFAPLATNTLVVGNNTVNLYIEDAEGNSSDTVEAIINVLNDLINPVITFNGPDSLQVVQNTSYTDPGITYTDNACQPVLAPTEADNVTINIANTGIYTYVWTVEDNNGNIATATRYVTVIGTDDTAPVITDLGSQNNMLEACVDAWTDPGVTAFDLVDFDVTSSVTTVITYDGSVVPMVDITVPGEYIITYTAQDAAAVPNVSTYVRTVFVDDTQAPVINLSTTESVLYLCLGSAYSTIEPNATAPANCLPAPSLTNNADVVVLENTVGSYTVTYTAVDDSLNTSTKTIEVKVGEAPVPAFTHTITGNNVSTQDVSTVGNPTNWIWDWDDNSKPSTAFSYTPTASHAYSSPGIRNICLTVTNKFTDACGVAVEDQKICEEINVEVGIAEVEKLNSSVNVYPNPSNGLVNVSVSQENLRNVEISIVNVIGDVIAKQTIDNTSKNSLVSFDLGENATGVYIVNIKTNKANTSKKVILK